MPGLAGVIRRDMPLHDPRRLLDMFRNVGLVDGVSYQYKSFCSDRAAILNTLTGLLKTADQPSIDPNGNIFLFLEGEVFNLDEIRLIAGCRPRATQCESLLALYLRRGDRFIESVNGECNIAIYDRAAGRLDLFCDHIASMPMYYMEQAGCLLFGSEKKFILSALEQPPGLEPLGLLQIVAHRHNLDELTFLKGVKRMMPGTQLTYHQGRLRLQFRELLAPQIRQLRSGVDDLRQEWAEQLGTAARLRVRGRERIFISLSGGLDSRAVACALPRELRPIWSRTRGSAASSEVTIAGEIAELLNFKHIQEDPLEIPHSSIIAKIAWRTECETPYVNALSIANHAALKNRCHFFTGGWLGDASSGAHIPAGALLGTSYRKFIERAYQRHLAATAESLSKLFNEEFLQRMLPELEEAFHASFPDRYGFTNVQNYEMWDIYQRQRRQTTSSMPVDSYLFEKIRPFYDKDYLNFVMSLPTSLRFGQTLYQSMIRRIGPEIRDVPSANNGLRLRGSILGNLGNKAATLAYRACTRRIRKIRPRYRNHIERCAPENFGAAIRGDAALRVLIERFMSSGDFDSSMFNRNGIRRMLADHYQGVSDNSYLLGHVATFSAGLPYFLNKTLRCPEAAQPLVIAPGKPLRSPVAGHEDLPVETVREARPARAQ